LNRGGVINLFGGLRRGDHVLELDSLDVHYRETRVVGSSGGDPWDMKDTLDLLASGDFDAGNYVYGVGGLEHTIEILERMSRERVNGRAIVYPHLKNTKFRQVDRWDAGLELELIGGTALYSRG
jgi:D-arabinose 1-dehydrogenase-like Zn-dependent alcohol dehydrogenase